MLTQSNCPTSTPLIDLLFSKDPKKREKAISILLVEIDQQETQARLNNLSEGRILLHHLMDKFATSFRQYLAGVTDTLGEVVDRINNFDNLRANHLEEYFIVKKQFRYFFNGMHQLIHNNKLNELIPRYEKAANKLRKIIDVFQDEDEYWEDEYNCALIEHNKRLISAKKQE